jgi:hypothetical protein
MGTGRAPDLLEPCPAPYLGATLRCGGGVVYPHRLQPEKDPRGRSIRPGSTRICPEATRTTHAVRETCPTPHLGAGSASADGGEGLPGDGISGRGTVESGRRCRLAPSAEHNPRWGRKLLATMGGGGCVEEGLAIAVLALARTSSGAF